MFFPHLLHISNNDLVLEIGPGGFPFWRADCLADKFDPADAVDLGQYGGKPMDIAKKPLFKIIDGKLPFKDKSFDYLVCSHVLEHVPLEDFSLMISEINRVAKRKYIEFPTVLYDYIYDFKVHTNFLDIVDGKIICLPKSSSNINAMKPFTDFAMLLRKSQNLGLEVGRLAIFGVGREYSGAIDFEIMSSAEEFFSVITKKYSNPIEKQYPDIMFRVKNLLQKWWRKVEREKDKSFFDALLRP